jgi:hypothetical protein
LVVRPESLDYYAPGLRSTGAAMKDEQRRVLGAREEQDFGPVGLDNVTVNPRRNRGHSRK